MKKNSVGILFLIFVACSSPYKKSVDIGIEQLETIHIGDKTQKVLDTLGKPSDKREDPSQTRDELWIYDDKNDSQIGAVAIDKTLQAVTAVTTIPKESDGESNLEYLLGKKFSSLSFEKVPLQRCERHYLPSQIFHINLVQGVVVISHRETKEVESFSRVQPNYAINLIKRIKDCKR